MPDQPSGCPFCYAPWTVTQILGEARFGGGYHMCCSECCEEWDDPLASHGQRETIRRQERLMSETRESVATNAAAWVLHHGYDDENDDPTLFIPDKDRKLAQQIVRRVLRHIDALEGPS